MGHNNIGNCYDEGKGVPQNTAEAIKWYRLAADLGSGRAMASLGLKYQYGDGVPKDFLIAHMWFDLAAVGSTSEDEPINSIVQVQRELVSKQMTPDQIAQAKHLAKEWMTAHSKK